MNSSELVSHRLHNQKLSCPTLRQPADVVRCFGAVQAQDFSGAKWALGLRMRATTDAAIQQAYNEGQILRTHLMRPTWHFVTAEDIRWLLALTAPRVNIKAGPNYRKFELDSTFFKRSHKVIIKALQGGKHLTRAALKTALNNAGVDPGDPVRLVHILLRAELEGVVCSGPMIGKQFSYALLEERVAAAKALTRDESLAKLSERYFTSHGPATLQDFVWWSGLTAVDARRGVEMIDRNLRNELVDEKTYFRPRLTRAVEVASPSAHLLPPYDEYNVAYKERQLVVDTNAFVGVWGLLGPAVIVDGKAVGTWRRIDEKNLVTVSLNILRMLSKREDRAIGEAVARFERFASLQLNPT